MIKKILYYWLPPLIIMALIFLVSSRPTAQVGPTYWTNFVAKKIAHVIEYSVLTITVLRAFKEYIKPYNKALFLTLCIVILFACSDEYHQSFVPKREPTVRDIFIDSSAATAIVLIEKYRQKPKKTIG